jgi:hypothetical protein
MLLKIQFKKESTQFDKICKMAGTIKVSVIIFASPIELCFLIEQNL